MPIDYKNYHEDWKDIIRPRILKRDKYTCQHCFLKRKTKYILKANQKVIVDTEFDIQYYTKLNIKIYTVILHVAHLNHDIDNNEDFNLLTLCSACHLKYDGKRHALSRHLRKRADNPVDTSRT
jgi:5-methylcytosine-specific restriction endonuclease McrA